ncbi:protein G12-like [Colletes latitarsis]|uniref:protein G12-like n=1 Tax=Colletes latitarsis TaxID=2605962 RepID=UPI0040367010
MMKFALLVLAALALASPLYALKVPSTGSGALARDFQAFVNLVPQQKVLKILKAYAAQDKEFQELMKLVDSEETKLFLKDIAAASEFKELVEYVQNAGLDIKLIMKKIQLALNIQSVAPQAAHVKITGGIRGVVKDIVDVLPVLKLRHLYASKRKSSQVFASFIKEVRSEKYWKYYSSVQSNEHLLNFIAEAVKVGLKRETVEVYYPFYIGARLFLKK